MTERLLLGHGSGERMMHELIEGHSAPAFSLGELLDSAVLDMPGGKVALTTDSYVVSPLFFPGGDIGARSVYGTVNDLLGLDPLYVANEGVMLAVVSNDVSEYLIDRMRQTSLGALSAVIGEVEESPEGSVMLRTEIWGWRTLRMLEGEQLPRIC